MKRNHLVWIGPLIAFAGAVSYFLVFVRWPVLRDFPWVNLPLTLAGLAVSVVAFRKRRPESRLSRALAWSGLGASTLFAGLFCFYIFYYSATLPAPTAATMELERAPGFALADQNGQVVRLEDMRGKNVVLVFFRGFWWPFCISELQGLQSRLNEFHAANTEVMGICRADVEMAREVADYYGIEFALLSDPDLEATGAYGLLHADGGFEGDIARPAVLIVDADGQVVWRHLTDDWRVRPRVEELLEVLERLP